MQACDKRLTPCLDVPSFFSPSRGSRSAESLWRNWIACFSLLCCLRAAASRTPESPRLSVRVPVNMTAVCVSVYEPVWSESVNNWVCYEESPDDELVEKRRRPHHHDQRRQSSQTGDNTTSGPNLQNKTQIQKLWQIKIIVTLYLKIST